MNTWTIVLIVVTVVLLAITVAAVICGAKYKKNKIAKSAVEAEPNNIEETEN